MRYYLNTATQEKPKEEGGSYIEYGKKETKGTGEDAKTSAIAALHEAYATMLKTKAIQYWVGKVEDTQENVLDKCECGTYYDASAETPIVPTNEGE